MHDLTKEQIEQWLRDNPDADPQVIHDMIERLKNLTK